MSQSSLFQVTVTNVTGAVFDGMVEKAIVPSLDGEMTILAHHEPLIALLAKGVITIVGENGEKTSYPITHGVLEVSNNKAIVLV